ncbi:hypothetical protein [Clostridium sp.]|uniref:hypothetical protein n=1 Tax=Clostridium sp. TaxID=1506 RepID=UPI0025B9715D|nr:hypothetical protein [Clostridium sp.]
MHKLKIYTPCLSIFYRFKIIAKHRSMKLVDIELINDESIYNVYMHSGSFKDDFPRNDFKIYNVKYYIKYKDDNKSVKDSG